MDLDNQNHNKNHQLNKIDETQRKREISFISFLKFKTLPELKAYKEKLKEESARENKISHEKALEIEGRLAKIKSEIKEAPKIESNELKEKLLALKTDMEQFRRQKRERLKELENKEKAVTEQMKNFMKKKHILVNKPLNLDNVTSKLKEKLAESEESSKEVQDFAKFIKVRGRTDGWPEDDHLVYLKYKIKYKNKTEKILSSVKKVFPDIHVSEIKKHDEFYDEYVRLKNAQKEALLKWRNSKKQSEDSSSEKSSNLESKSSSSATKPKSAPKKIPEDIKEKLMAWKMEKEYRNEVEKNFQLQNEESKKQELILRKQKNEEIKKMIESWKITKCAQENFKKFEENQEDIKTKAFRSLLANRLIKEFQSQDLKFIEKMQKSRVKTNNEKNGRCFPRSVTQIVVNRDPNRHLKPTQQWISRTLTKPEPANETLCHLNNIKKLGVPQWRKV